MKTNIIINGDALYELKKLPSESIDLIFADPPYWMRTEGVLNRVEGTEYDGCDDKWDQFNSDADYKEFTMSWLRECYRTLKPNGSFWVIGGMQCIYTIGACMQDIGFWFINDIIWHKKNPTPNFRGTRLNNSHETLIWATKSKKAKFTFNYKTAKELNLDNVEEQQYKNGIRKQMGSVWRIAVCQGKERLKDVNNKKLHNTQKPEELLYRIIAIASKEGDIVLDPFGGTMTTAAMAKKMGRKYITIECDKEYCKYGKERLDNVEIENSDITRASFDIKPKPAKMEDMIKSGYFAVGEWFFLKDGSRVATLEGNGKLNYGGNIIDMHSCAALARKVKAKRLNGFDVWYVEREKKLVSIDVIREKYRENN